MWHKYQAHCLFEQIVRDWTGACVCAICVCTVVSAYSRELHDYVSVHSNAILHFSESTFTDWAPIISRLLALPSGLTRCLLEWPLIWMDVYINPCCIGEPKTWKLLVGLNPTSKLCNWGAVGLYILGVPYKVWESWELIHVRLKAFGIQDLETLELSNVCLTFGFLINGTSQVMSYLIWH